MKIKTLFTIGLLTFGAFSISAQNTTYGCPPGNGGGPNSPPPLPISGGGSSYNPLSAGITSLNALDFSNETRASNQYEIVKATYSSIKGSPFLNKKPTQGTIVTNTGNTIKNIPMQVDMYSHNIIATNEDGKDMVLDGRFYEEVIIPHDGKNLVFKKANPATPDKFYEVLYEDGDMVFFKEDNIKIREGKSYGGISGAESKFSRTGSDYFIKTEGQGVVKVKLKKKDILSVFPDAELEAMKYYAQSKGIKFKNESDYVAVFDGVHSMEE